MEYIEREKIGLTSFEMLLCNYDYKEALKTLLDKIDNIPAADVRPVVRGRWKRVEDEFGKYDRCSNCGKEYAFGPIVTMHFCPNCGADMRDANDEKA